MILQALEFSDSKPKLHFYNSSFHGKLKLGYTGDKLLLLSNRSMQKMLLVFNFFLFPTLSLFSPISLHE